MNCSKCGKEGHEDYDSDLIFIPFKFFLIDERDEKIEWLYDAPYDPDESFYVLPFCIDCLPINALKLGQLGVKIDPYKEEKDE